jgi:TATA-box binding protein (TBP) (component of TFIID and TFIIIB)
MNLYANHAVEQWIYESENQQIGLIHRLESNQSVMLPFSEALVGLGAKNPCT